MSIQKSRIYEDFTKINRALDDAEKEHATAADLQRRKAAYFDWLQTNKARIGYITFSGECEVACYPNAPSLTGSYKAFASTLLEAVESAMAKEREGK